MRPDRAGKECRAELGQIDPVVFRLEQILHREAVARLPASIGEPAHDDDCDHDHRDAEDRRIPGVMLEAQVVLVGSQRQEDGNQAYVDYEPLAAFQAVVKAQCRDQKGEPVGCPIEQGGETRMGLIKWGRIAEVGSAQLRQAQIDGQIDPRQEAGLQNGASLRWRNNT